MSNTSPTKYIENVDDELEEKFGKWYRENNIPCANFWFLIQAYQFLMDSKENKNELIALIEYTDKL